MEPPSGGIERFYPPAAPGNFEEDLANAFRRSQPPQAMKPMMGGGQWGAAQQSVRPNPLLDAIMGIGGTVPYFGK